MKIIFEGLQGTYYLYMSVQLPVLGTTHQLYSTQASRKKKNNITGTKLVRIWHQLGGYTLIPVAMKIQTLIKSYKK
jgi:hypothetical protein